MKKFPDGFYWGAATASYQVEGNIYNNDWAKAAEEGGVPYAGKLADHYNLYTKDFDLAKELGHNAHRFSIEWARIEPEEGVFDEKEIEHYREVLRALRARNIEPFTTLWHFTLPLWFTKSGGFERKDAPEVFARYCAKVVAELGDQCTYFTTMNEPMVVSSQGYLIGQFPPFKRAPFVAKLSLQDRGKDKQPLLSWKHFLLYFKMENAYAAAHNAAYDAMKKVNPDVDVSIVKHTVYFHRNKNPLYAPLVWVMNWYWTYRFMDKVIDQCDSVGLNYYQHKKFGDDQEYELTDMGWQIFPEGIEGALKILWKYKKPLYVSEAGCADQKDTFRAEYIRKQVSGVQKAIEDGVDVRGHMYWSLMDNYEWALGTEKRFGLIEIDYDTLQRKVRPSAQVYKKIIQNNGIL